MLESYEIQAQNDRGEKSFIEIKHSEFEPWVMWVSSLANSEMRFEGADLFEILKDVRRYLESMGWQLLCNGACKNVLPSGMARDANGGRIAAVLGGDSDRSKPPRMVNIFLDDYIEDGGSPVSVVEQEQWFVNWRKSLGQ